MQFPRNHGQAWPCQSCWRLSCRWRWPYTLLSTVTGEHSEKPSTPQGWLLQLFHTGCQGHLSGTAPEWPNPKRKSEISFCITRPGLGEEEISFESSSTVVWGLVKWTTNCNPVGDWQTFLAKDQRVNILGFVLCSNYSALQLSHQTATDNTEQWNAGFQILPKPYENKKTWPKAMGFLGNCWHRRGMIRWAFQNELWRLLKDRVSTL